MTYKTKEKKLSRDYQLLFRDSEQNERISLLNNTNRKDKEVFLKFILEAEIENLCKQEKTLRGGQRKH